MMKKIITTCLLFFAIASTFAQNSHEDIQTIQNYIQKTSQNEWFDPINKKGSLSNNTTYDTAYYLLSNDSVFSIIHTVYEKHTLQKVFYYKEGALIACIVEETDANNANRLLQYADYFFKDGALLNTGDEKEAFPAAALFTEGMEKLQNVPVN